MSTTGTTVDELGRRRLARAAATTDSAEFARHGRDDWSGWLSHLGGAAAGCSHPIRLAGSLTTVETSTGRITSEAHTSAMPDAVLYVPCGNRRASVCASCAETYRADTYQLVTAGLLGGKGVPPTVAEHPCVFLTCTAPSFGPVHTARTDAKGRALPCHPRRTPDTCVHGIEDVCWDRHDEHGGEVGRPLCLDCYDHDHQAVWNHSAGELWRRTMVAATRALRRLEQPGAKLRLSYTKVAEYQTRGAVHFHALVRLDGRDPDDPTAILTPNLGIRAGHVALLLREAVHGTVFRTDAHPERPKGWRIEWGEQCDPRPVRLTVRDVDDAGEITHGAVAGYLAKYATKATEMAGHVSTRLDDTTAAAYADPATHVGRQIEACWRLGTRPHREDAPPPDAEEWRQGWGRLRRWAHMLGFGGHFSTRSRRYSTTMTALRAARRDWARAHAASSGPEVDERGDQADHDSTEVVVASLAFAGIGWHTTADALMANTAAANARARRLAARDELTGTTA